MIKILIVHQNTYYAAGLSAAIRELDDSFSVHCVKYAIGLNAGDYDVVITPVDALMSLCRNRDDVFSDKTKIILLKDDIISYTPEHLYDISIKTDAPAAMFGERIHMALGTEKQKLMRLKRHRDKLSSREYQVALALLSLKKNKEIGDLLGINEKTVSTYKLRVFRKLCIKSVLELSVALRSHSVI